MSSSRRWLRGPRLVALGLVGALALAEVGLRAFTDLGRMRLAESSARYGHRLLPGQTARHRGRVERINAHGYRDAEWAAPGERPDVLRVAVLGNSVPYGVGVDQDEPWPEVLEERLRARAAAAGAEGEVEGEVEVMNFAVPGYVVEQMKRVCLDQVLAWRPRVVILCVGFDAVLPMRPRSDPVRYPGRRLVRRSALWELLDLNLRRRAELAIEDSVREVQRRVRAAPYAPEQQELWDAAFADLAELELSVRAAGARLVLVENPLLAAVLEPERVPPSMSLERWADAHEGVVHLATGPALAASMAELLAELEARGLHPRDLWNRRFAGAHELEHRDRAAFFPDGPYHLTPRGHRVVAETVLAGLEAHGLR